MIALSGTSVIGRGALPENELDALVGRGLSRFRSMKKRSRGARPFCQQDDDRVIDSRSTDDDTAIRRRRECKACGQRFTTYERVENEEQIRVVKRDGSRQLFDRRKIMTGLTVACEKRPVSASI